jgi:hypothetical protein
MSFGGYKNAYFVEVSRRALNEFIRHYVRQELDAMGFPGRHWACHAAMQRHLEEICVTEADGSYVNLRCRDCIFVLS